MTSTRSHGAFAIRPLRPDDAEGIAALYAAMAAEPDIGPITAGDWTRTIALPQFGGGRDLLVALDGTGVVVVTESSLRDGGTGPCATSSSWSTRPCSGAASARCCSAPCWRRRRRPGR